MHHPHMSETRRFTVSGVVQGVWFRRHTADKAHEIGITGWVRNTREGTVELVARGDNRQIQLLEAALWRGSPMSDVKAVHSEVADEFTGQGFEILADE